MNIIEAAEAAMAGKRVQIQSKEAIWESGRLAWKCNDNSVPITLATLSNDWRIIPDPPKLYPFSEAFSMMKQGKWMKSMASDRVIALKGGYWSAVLRGMNSHAPQYPIHLEDISVIAPLFTVYEIEGQWQEVTE